MSPLRSQLPRAPRLTRAVGVLLAVVGAVVAFVLIGMGAGQVVSAATPGANFVSTGHDMDFHCAGGSTDECSYLKIVLDKVRNGSTLPVLALDHGIEVATALTNAGYAAADVTTVDPNDTAALGAVSFVTAGGAPAFSAIITASDTSCGGCDNDTTSSTNINARTADFKAFFNAGGGILALAGAANPDYYNFVPITGVTTQPVTQPFAPTAAGVAIGITPTMANCCATHNSFSLPPAPLVTLETDSTGIAETIAAFGASIGTSGFTSSAPPTTSAAPTSESATPSTSAPILASTGTQHVASMLGAGGALVVAGAGLLLWSRGRRPSERRH